MLSGLLPAAASGSIHIQNEAPLVAQKAFLQSVMLRVRLYQCTRLQATAEAQLGRATDAEASQRKALSYVDPAADLPVQQLMVEWRTRFDPGELCFCHQGMPLFAMYASQHHLYAVRLSVTSLYVAGEPLLYEVLESAFGNYLTAQKEAVVMLYMTLAKQTAEGGLSQDKQKALQAELADLQAKADSIAATLPKSDTWRLQRVIEELRLAQQSDLV